MDSASDSFSSAMADLNLQTAAGDASSAATIAMDELQEECEHSWLQVKMLQQQLTEASQQGAGASTVQQAPAGQQSLVLILKEKERRLRAEIEVLGSMEPQALPNNPMVLEATLMESLQKEILQLKETLSLVESQHQELRASIQQEEQFKEQLEAVGEKLQEKCDSLERQEEPEDVVDVVMQELEAKINAARHTEQTVMKKMAEFVGKHFPLPDPEQVVKSSKELRSRKKQSSKQTSPLKDLLLELMTKCVENPEDPYLMLDERHWPAYIELLSRCNIILQHPDDDRRVKLVPFHL